MRRNMARAFQGAAGRRCTGALAHVSAAFAAHFWRRAEACSRAKRTLPERARAEPEQHVGRLLLEWTIAEHARDPRPDRCRAVGAVRHDERELGVLLRRAAVPRVIRSREV